MPEVALYLNFTSQLMLNLRLLELALEQHFQCHNMVTLFSNLMLEISCNRTNHNMWRKERLFCYEFLSFQTIHYIIHASKSSKFKLQIVFSAGDDQMTMEPEKKGRKYDQMLWEISESLLQYIPFFPWPDTHDQTFLFQEAFQCRNHWASIASPPLRPSKESVITSICNIKSCESSKDPSYATNRPEPLDSYHIKTIIPQKKSTINFSVCSNS